MLPVVQKVNNTELHRLELFRDAIRVMKDVVAQCAPEQLHNRFDSCRELLGSSISYLSSTMPEPTAAFVYDLPCKAAAFDTFSWPDCPLRERIVSQDVNAQPMLSRDSINTSSQTGEGAPEDANAGAQAAEAEAEAEAEEEEDATHDDVPRQESDSDSEGHQSILRPSSKDSFKRARKLVEELLEYESALSPNAASLTPFAQRKSQYLDVDDFASAAPLIDGDRHA